MSARSLPDCLFCRIARGEIPAAEVYRDDDIVAFLDLGPIRPGHVLVIPTVHYPYFDDLPADLATRILHLGQRLARVQKAELGAERVGFMFSGNDLAHAHAHVLPLHTNTDLTSARYIQGKMPDFAPLPPDPPEVLAAMAAKLSAALK